MLILARSVSSSVPTAAFSFSCDSSVSWKARQVTTGDELLLGVQNVDIDPHPDLVAESIDSSELLDTSAARSAVTCAVPLLTPR